MEEESKKVDKRIYKVLLLLAKVIPMVIALLHLLNMVLAYFNYDAVILNYVGGISILTLIFFYVVSYTLKFCEYHRMFLHYILLNNLISIYDNYIGIPVNDGSYLMINLIIAEIFLFIILYLKFNCNEHKYNKTSVEDAA